MFNPFSCSNIIFQFNGGKWVASPPFSPSYFTFFSVFMRVSKQQVSTWLERTGSLSNALGGSREHIKGIFILSSVCGNISNNFYFASKYSAKLLAICFAELLGLDSYIFPEPSCQIIIPSIPTFSTTYKLCLIFLFAAHSL